MRNITGGLSIQTEGERIGISNGETPVVAEALFHAVNEGGNTCTVMATSYWEGSTAEPFQNNDTSLWVTFNKVNSDSQNRSWSGSFCNAYNDIPAGVRDSGTRVGAIGWAVSVNHPLGYKHDGTLFKQIGMQGTSGFQGPNSGTSAIIEEAVGVHGAVYNDSIGSTVKKAKAGEFITANFTGTVKENIGVYSNATGGQTNYSFYGEAGEMFNAAKASFATLDGQATNTAVSVRHAGNGVEFGHPDPAGYGSAIGATTSRGFPFVAFNAEADPAGDTYRTRGKKGAVIHSDLLGSIVFTRLVDPHAAGQSPVESMRICPDGRLSITRAPPSSSSAYGRSGTITWDENYVYVCVGENSWKRTLLSSW